MDTTIMFTPSQAIAAILAICGAIASIAAAAAAIGKIVAHAKKPNEEQNHRLDDIERRLKEHDEKFKTFAGYLETDKGRLNDIEIGNRVTQQAILALLSHAIDGNNIEPLKHAEENLQQYLINRR